LPFHFDGITNTFFHASLIEAWGQGIFKMIADCVEAKVPPPIFKCDLSDFVKQNTTPGTSKYYLAQIF
jgi:predicted HTH transcriptional regulator